MLKKCSLTILALLALELIARITAGWLPYTQLSTARYTHLSKDIGYERRTDWTGDVLQGAPRTFDASGYFQDDGTQLLNPNLKRVMLLGDSCTFGVALPLKLTYGELIDNQLAEYAIINLSLPGYSSYQSLQIMKKYIETVNPSLIIAAANYNDRRYVLQKSMIDGPRKFITTYYEAKFREALVNISYLARWMYALVTTIHPTNQACTVNVNNLFPRVSPASYRQNLEAMTHIAKERGVPILFISLSDNPVWTDYLDRGVQNIKNEAFDLAIINLKAVAMTPTPFTALGKRYLSMAYQQKERFEEAEKARDHTFNNDNSNGQYPLFLDSDYRDIMQSVAEQKHAIFIDAGSEMEMHPDYYIDACHFNAEGHSLIADLVMDALGDLGFEN